MKGAILCETQRGVEDVLYEMSEKQLESLGCLRTKRALPTRITSASRSEDRVVRIQLVAPDQVVHAWGKRFDLGDILASAPGASKETPMVWDATVKNPIYCFASTGPQKAHFTMTEAALRQIGCILVDGEYRVRPVDGSHPDDPVVRVEIEYPNLSVQRWIKREAAGAFESVPAK